MFNFFKKQKPVSYVTKVLPLPNNQTQEALYLLIQKEKMTRRDFFLETHILNAPQIISSLRKCGVDIDCRIIKTRNKFGRIVSYGIYVLENEMDAIKTYLKLTKKINDEEF